MKLSKRVRISVSVICMYVLSQFFVGYESETVNLFSNDTSFFIICIIIVIKYLYLYKNNSKKNFMIEYWFSIGLSILVIHGVTFAFMCLMGDFFFALNGFLRTGLMLATGFLVPATPSFFLILMYRAFDRDKATSDSDVPMRT